MGEIPAGNDLKNELHIQLLSGFAVSVGGVRLPQERWKSRRARSLVKLLALTPGQRLHRDQVIDTFWPDSELTSAVNNFHQSLYAARQVLEDHKAGRLILEEGFVCLMAGQGGVLRVDVEQFEAAAARANDLQDPKAYQDALALYTGDLLPDDLYEEWTIPRRSALRQVFLQLLLDLAKRHETLREYPQGIAALQQVLSMDPGYEEAHVGLMRLYALSDQRQQALRQYQVLSDVLHRELGVEPGPNTTQLYEAIQSGHFSAAPQKSQPSHNLPVQLTAAIGREQEIEHFRQLILSRGNRLVTLVGGGGSGKTRLALEAARTLLPVFTDGVYLVELDARQAQETLAPLIARAVGLERGVESTPFGGPAMRNLEERLFSFLQDKKMLLILDGFEGLLSETGWLSSLLRRTSGLTILVTSRIRLNLNVEQSFVLEGLPYPPQAVDMENLGSYGAVRLFVETARRANPDFALSAENSRSVAAICRLLQGMPLGILLSAAWSGILEPEQIVEHIRRSLDILAADWADLPDRQRSLRATFEYSLHMLGQAERIAFLRLSVFRGAFTAQRAGQVAEVSLNTLKILVDHSLLRPAGQGRFRIHELLRQYAQEKLAADPSEERAVRERHCQVFLTDLAALEPRLKSSELFQVLLEMDPEYPDLLEAWDWAVEHGDFSLLENIVWSLGRYQKIRYLASEGAAWCEKTMNLIEQERIGPRNFRLWVRMGNWLANFYLRQSKFEPCRQVLERVDGALRAQPGLAANLRREQAFLQINYGDYCYVTMGNNLQVLKYYQKGLDLIFGLEDPWDISFGLMCVAGGQGIVGNHRECQKYAELGLVTLRPSGDPILIQELLEQRGFVLMITGQLEEAIRNVEEQVSYLQQFNDPLHSALIPGMRGLARFHAGLYEEARPLVEQAAALYNQAGDRENRFFYLWILDMIQLATGNYTAVRLGPGMSAEDQAELAQTRYKTSVRITWGILSLLRQDWIQAEQNLQSYYTYLIEVTRQDMMGIPLAYLGLIAYHRGDLHLAHQRLIAALDNGVTHGYYYSFCAGLGVLALILAEAGELERAVELYATATAHPGAGNSHFFNDILGKPIAAQAENLPAETVQAARARGRNRELEAAGQEYLAKLKASADLISALLTEQAHSE